MLCSFVGFSQENQGLDKVKKTNRFYFEWGYNRAWHSKSDVHLKGDGYDYTLKNVTASDLPASFDPSVYFSLGKFSIPQFNVRLGYYINDKYSISIGYDHMKYVLDNWKNATISGYISSEALEEQAKYDHPEIKDFVGSYDNDEIYLGQNFIKYEHTDGLNYVRINLDRSDRLWTNKNGKVAIEMMNGVGLGPVVPWTDYTHLSGKRHTNRLHISGLGFSVNSGIKAEFFEKFYIQSNAVGGYINMPWIETAMGQSDSAEQQFYFFQFNVVAGVYFYPLRLIKN